MKKKAKNDEKADLRLERFFGVIGVVFSLIALYFSWQANQIALQQIKDNVFSPSSIYVWATHEEDNSTNSNNFACIQRTRLSNLGGANSTIIKYDATLYFHDKSTTVSGEENYPLNASSLEDINTGYVITGFRIEFVDGDTLEGSESIPVFPISVPPYTTVDVWTKAKFIIVGESLTASNYYYPPYDYSQFIEQVEDSPIEISFKFTTASGKSFSTPRVLCMFVK